eukprot:4242770-Pyramimonas_sp.AAC.1
MVAVNMAAVAKRRKTQPPATEHAQVICEAAGHGQVGWGLQYDVIMLMRGSAKRITEGLKQGLLDVHDGS